MGKVVAVIPVREGSQRVKHKNFQPFAQGPSLLERKINHLKSANCFDDIYVSSDSTLAQEIAKKQGVSFLQRSSIMCSSEVKWADVIKHVAETVPGQPEIAWCHTTSPLFKRYKEALEAYKKNIPHYNSLLTVTPCQEFLLKENGRPLNYQWGYWHDYSQDLEKLYSVTGALFIASKENIIKWSYLIGTKPLYFHTSKIEAIDIDEVEDFKMAEYLLPFQENFKHQEEG